MFTPTVIDYALSRIRRPNQTLEARAEKQFGKGASMPRTGRVGGSEYDEILRSLSRESRKSLPSYRLRPWLARTVELRSRTQILLGRNAIIRGGAILNGRSRSHSHGLVCGDDFYVKENVYIDAYGGYIQIGRGAALAQATAIHGNGGVEIGDYFMMGHGAMVLAGNHNHALTGLPFIFQGSTTRGVCIGTNVWVGAGAIVLDGSSIGDNVVVGAGTIVTGDIPSDSIAIGNREVHRVELNS